MNQAEAVATEHQGVRHRSEIELADVERRLVGPVRIRVGDDHLGDRGSVQDRSHATVFLVADAMEDQSLACVEADAEAPALPANLVSVDLEARTFGLGDLDRPQVGPQVRLKRGAELAVPGGERHGLPVLEVDELHRVDVDDAEHPFQRPSVCVAAGMRAHERQDSHQSTAGPLVLEIVVPDGDRIDVDE